MALEVDRPVLPTITFDDLKAQLLQPLDEKDGEDIKDKPQPKFLELLD